MNARRLPIERIAITTPPVDWFFGLERPFAGFYRQALVDLGLQVFDVPVDAFLPPDANRISQLVSDLKTFRPQLGLGLAHGNYALICRMPPRRDGFRPNLFTDVLDIPTICLWDHAPLELADQLLAPHPESPATSVAGAHESLRSVLTHPRLIHWSHDSGQAKIMSELGFLLPGHLIEELPAALRGHLKPTTLSESEGGRDPRAAFVGHIYQEPFEYPHPALATLAGEVIREFVSGFSQPIWNVLATRIAGLPDELRRELALDRDQTYFWRFAHRMIVHQAQTAFRLRVLGGANVPVVCYGNLQGDLAGVSGKLIPAGRVGFGLDLTAMFHRHAIMIDVLNPGFVNGYNEKQVDCFNAGGLMLMNRKQDFVDAFGEAGEEVSYVDTGDLASKVDRFLGNPRYRREVGDAIRERITLPFQLKDVLCRALHAASAIVKKSGSKRRSAFRAEGKRQVTKVMDLLPELQSKPHWSPASVQPEQQGVLVSTGPQPWAYAAVVGIPNVAEMREPHLRVTLVVEAGSLGIAAMSDTTGKLIAEQCVSKTSSPITVTVELPHTGVTMVMFRNLVEGPTRALVMEASLCDRGRPSI